MPTEKKVANVKELRDRIERATIIMSAEYRGLTVTQLGDLRRAIRDAGVDMKVVKNRLFLRAASEAQKPGLAELLEGPTAVIFGYEDVAAAAKAVTEHQRTARNAFAVRKAMMDGQLMTTAELQDLATLPTKPVLLGQLIGLLQTPVQQLATLLNASMQNLAGLIDSRARQLDEQSPPATEAQPAAAEASAAEPAAAEAEPAPATAADEPATESEPAAESEPAPETPAEPAAEEAPAAEPETTE